MSSCRASNAKAYRELLTSWVERGERIRELEAALVVSERDLAQAREEDAAMVRDRDDALLALGEAALKIERIQQEAAAELSTVKRLRDKTFENLQKSIAIEQQNVRDKTLEIERLERDHDERDGLLSKLWDIVNDDGADHWNGKPLDEIVAGLIKERNSIGDAYDRLLDEGHRCTPAERALIEAAFTAYSASRNGSGDWQLWSAVNLAVDAVIAERGKA